MFHLLGYSHSSAANDANVDMSATTDPVFTQRNNHFIFSEQYNSIAQAGMGASASTFRLSMPSVNAIALHHIFPVNPAITPSSYPRYLDLRNNPQSIPMSEERQWLESDTGAELVTVFEVIAPDGMWNRQLPPSSPLNRRVLLQFTATVTRVAQAWSGGTAITFEQTPRGGWYCVNACYVTSTNARAFRLLFPRNPMAFGRILRPGWLVNSAVGNLIDPYFADGLGEWGRFHTFEPFQIEEWADASGSDSITGTADVTFLGDTPTYSPYPTGGIMAPTQ
jgi:hypothetical protein